MIFAGVDAGSRAIKLVLLSADRQVLARGQVDQAVRQGELAEGLYDTLLKQVSLTRRDVAAAVATGYARRGVGFAAKTITEITCHARGVHHLLPQARTVVEVGGQDSKLLHLEADGAVRDFAMNDRCAAGTGRFLEMLAGRLEVPLAGLGDMARRSGQPAPISSMCVVFAETEIIGLLAAGRSCPDIVAGVQSAIAARVASMAAGAMNEPVVLTGGVALVGGMDEAFAAALKCPVAIAPDPQYTGALGAALLAAAMKRDRGGKL
jgi:(R)-2-hydroxyacyl-CoA dehydratese activating ATPase